MSHCPCLVKNIHILSLKEMGLPALFPVRLGFSELSRAVFNPSTGTPSTGLAPLLPPPAVSLSQTVHMKLASPSF